MNIAIVEKKETGEKYAIKLQNYFTCWQFDGEELKINGESYQILDKNDVKIIGEIDNLTGEEIIY